VNISKAQSSMKPQTSDIDAIFSGAPTVEIERSVEDSGGSKPKKVKKSKSKSDRKILEKSDVPTKQEAVVVHDPSLIIHEQQTLQIPASAAAGKLQEDDERAFRSSRGGQSRGKTEEGWNIYSTAELKILEPGQDPQGTTDLCPFDCQCCF